MIRHFCCILVLLGTFKGLLGQDSKVESSIPIDSLGQVSLKEFKEALQDKYVGDEFNYHTERGESQNLLERFFRWLGDILSDTFGINISPEAMQLMELVIYILMGLLVIYLLVKFFVGENFGSIFTKKAVPMTEINLTEQHIEELDLDKLITNALENKDYRLAIRYNYLKALKLLSQKNIIEWHFEKTNRDYQREMDSHKLKPIFQEVSYLYDHIWYGEQPIGNPVYEAAKLRFNALKNQIS